MRGRRAIGEAAKAYHHEVMDSLLGVFDIERLFMSVANKREGRVRAYARDRLDSLILKRTLILRRILDYPF